MFTMKLFFLGLVAVALAAEGSSDAPAAPTVEVLTEKAFVDESGYNFAYKLSDGVAREEQGELITVGDHQGIGIKGSYSYVAPDGQEYTVTYTADDKGFNPVIRASPAGKQ